MDIKLDIAEAQKAAQKAPEATVEAIHRTLQQVALFATTRFRQNMPVGATGNLRRSVNYRWLTKASIVVEPTTEVAEYVEHGTKPHFPPVDALRPWAMMKGIEPWALARSIAKKGTRAHPFLIKTYVEVEPYAQNALKENIDEVIRSIYGH